MHSIRLRGPWEISLPGNDPPLRIDMPATWQTLLALTAAAAPLPSPARLVRRFGFPTGIGAHDRLNLVIESCEVAYQVELNGQQLGNVATDEPSKSFDVTALLNPRNELVVVLEIPAGNSILSKSAIPLGEIRLDITPGQAGDENS